MTPKIEFISAGAGSGKTYALTEALNNLLSNESIRPKAVIATTFTRMAAKELKDRVRQSLIEIDRVDLSEKIDLAQIGTVNSVCGRLLERFAFEAGIPPDQETLDEAHANNLFRRSLDQVLQDEPVLVAKMNRIAKRLSIDEWEKEVKTIADRARANNMSPQDILTFADTSYQSLLHYFPKPKPSFDENVLAAAMRDGIAGIKAQIENQLDTTGTTSNYLNLLLSSKHLLEQGDLPWASWAGLAKKSAGAKSRDYSNRVMDAASDFGAHPLLHEDVTVFTQNLFKFAADSLEEYQDLKARQGLVDFVDQEQRLYQTLENEAVQQSLQSDLDLLMVDEFQDTSPIQLAVFMKLASLSKKVIFVGDVKQSIYGFRGADPALMEAILQDLEGLGITERILDKSWRSRPPLVSFVNDIFSQTFAPSLRRDQICLAPAREEVTEEPAIETWELEGKTIGSRLPGLVRTTAALISEKHAVIDKGSGNERTARYGDIAILCKTNKRLKDLAEVFASAQIPTKLVLPGLLKTPEATLAAACLRLLADPSDMIAAAEIHTLSTCESPEVWLPERLEQLKDPENRANEWTIDRDGIFERLKTARERTKLLTPIETLRLAIQAGQVRVTARRWGPTETKASLREKNIGRVIELADEYIQQCDLQNEPATVAGLITYFEKLSSAELDLQAAAGTEDAISLLTHHGAKGLEWPIVVLMDLDAEPRSSVWGLSVIPNVAGIVPADPLNGRSLRYWAPIFGDNTKDIDILDKIIDGPECSQSEQRERLEQQRLLYVSMTRARDKLVFAIPTKKTPSFPWAETLNVGLFWPGAADSQFTSKEYKGVSKLIGQTEIEDTETIAYIPNLIDLSLDTPTLPLHLTPSSFAPIESATIAETVVLGDRISTHDKYDVTAMGEALHAIIAGQLMGHNATDDILKRHSMDGAITTQDSLEAATRFETFLKDRFVTKKVNCEHPIKYHNEHGQIVSGWIDLLLETDQGFVIIDHKASPRPRSEWDEIALSYSGQLKAYAEGLKAAYPEVKIETWVHFAITGGMLKVEG